MSNKTLGSFLLLALLVLALVYGRDPSIFCAAMAIVLAMPEQVK